jgi:bisphosphoglycerate-dependent phosphoglycerate mutase
MLNTFYNLVAAQFTTTQPSTPQTSNNKNTHANQAHFSGIQTLFKQQERGMGLAGSFDPITSYDVKPADVNTKNAPNTEKDDDAPDAEPDLSPEALASLMKRVNEWLLTEVGPNDDRDENIVESNQQNPTDISLQNNE